MNALILPMYLLDDINHVHIWQGASSVVSVKHERDTQLVSGGLILPKKQTPTPLNKNKIKLKKTKQTNKPSNRKGENNGTNGVGVVTPTPIHHCTHDVINM